MDLTEIAKLYTTHGPFVSLYLNTPMAVENAAQRTETAWRTTRRDLIDNGVDEPTADALEKAVLDGGSGNALIAYATHGSVLYSRRMPEELAKECALFTSLPYVTPLLAWRQTRLPYVVALADRTGVEILAYADEPTPVISTEVEGSHDVITRSHPGGWSAPRYQRRAIDSWQGNAKEAVEDIDRIAWSIDAKAIFLGGDTQELHWLQEYLPERAKTLVQVLERGGGRAADGGEPFTAEEVTERVGQMANDRLRTTLEKFEEERGQHDQATDGILPTVEALRMAKVATLLVHDDVEDDRTLWFGEDPSLVATSAEDLKGVAQHVEEGRLADVLIRAAVGTGADVIVVPTDDKAAPRQGCGAILRYSV